MSARIDRPEAATLAGGALVMLGAWLPWLTLYAGLERYGGLIGLHGRILFAGGLVAILGSLAVLATRHRLLRSGTALLGLTLFGFTCWLLAGLGGTLRHGVSAMLVPRAGPGLFVSLAGAALIAIGPALAPARRSRIADSGSVG